MWLAATSATDDQGYHTTSHKTTQSKWYHTHMAYTFKAWMVHFIYYAWQTDIICKNGFNRTINVQITIHSITYTSRKCKCIFNTFAFSGWSKNHYELPSWFNHIKWWSLYYSNFLASAVLAYRDSYRTLVQLKPGSYQHIWQDTTTHDVKVLVSRVKCRDSCTTSHGNSWEAMVSLHKSS